MILWFIPFGKQININVDVWALDTVTTTRWYDELYDLYTYALRFTLMEIHPIL